MNSVTIVRKFRMNRSTDRERAPEAAEALVDQPGVADAGDGAEPDDHLLVDDQHRDQQQQHPQQAGAVVLAGLGVGGDAARVVVADHHDQPGPMIASSATERGAPGRARPGVVAADRAERARGCRRRAPSSSTGGERRGGSGSRHGRRLGSTMAEPRSRPPPVGGAAASVTDCIRA